MSRDISKESANAFEGGCNFKKSNTAVYIVEDRIYLSLHGNLIARKSLITGKLEITNAGWQTNVTKERLNALPNTDIRQVKGVWYLNGQAWNGEWIAVN